MESPASEDFIALFGALAARLAEFRTGGSIVPCSEQQIEEVRQVRGPHLPVAYAAFLRVMGVRAGVLWLAEDFFYPSLLLSNDDDLAEFARDRERLLPDGHRTIIMDHAGYEYQWLQWTSEQEEDPPVWRILGGHEEPVKCLAASFTGYVSDQVSAWERYLEENPEFVFPRVSRARQ